LSTKHSLLASASRLARACAFYAHFGFVASPGDPLHLFILTKELRRVAGGMEGRDFPPG
jgi:hypothetical protein